MAEYYAQRLAHWTNVRQSAAGAMRFTAALKAKRCMRFYEDGIARCNGKWPEDQVTGEEYAETGAHDLDLIGENSLYSQICIARTGAGQATLAKWLQNPVGPQEAFGRQEAIRELRDRVELREAIARCEEGGGRNTLNSWAQSKAEDFPSWTRPLAVLFFLIALTGAILAITGKVPKEVAFAAAVPEALLGAALSARTKPVLEAITLPVLDLPLLLDIIHIIQQQTFTSPFLKNLQAAVQDTSHLKHLKNIGWAAEFRRNEIFAAFSYFLLWGTQVAAAAEQWRFRHAQDLQRWLDAVGAFEALHTLAAYTYEHNHHVFPELADSPEPFFQADDLGHPLLPYDQCVRSSIRLGGADPHLYIVSGSNMSGKSTFLRAIGLNVALGWAGAPVRAKSLRMSRLITGASIQVQDSLVAGTSRFLAEAQRLRDIIGKANLFLLDEILSGTNSADRRVAAEVIAHTLVRKGSIGLITSHDLALTEIEGAANIHFENYHLCQGVVTRSNALEILRSVGIEV